MPRQGRELDHAALAQVVAKRRRDDDDDDDDDAGLYDMPQNAVRHSARANEAHNVREQRPVRGSTLHFVHALLLEPNIVREGSHLDPSVFMVPLL